MNFWTLISIPISIATYYYYTKGKADPSTMVPSSSTSSHTASALASKFIKNVHPLPTFFFSHGGPTFMYEDDPFGNKGAWRTIKKLGQTIKSWKPDYILVVSAHWQSRGSNLIEINKIANNSSENPLIYDFYGFPSYMYKEEFHTKNDEFIANHVKQELVSNSFDCKVVERGIDHGVWVPFKVAFSDYTTQTTPQPKVKGLDLDCPVIQVSLAANDSDFDTHYKLGKVLNHFRSNKIWDERQEKYLTGMVICSGMSVHNLRDLGYSMRQPEGVMPYVKPFNKLLTNILENEDNNNNNQGDDLLTRLNNLKNLHILRQAHPTLEHFLPIVVAGGIANDSNDRIKELYNDEYASLGWGVYQVGEFSSSESVL
ncbi:hypothetical protein KGF56_002114 [Candida oxycetoniae]|uniref:Extradiol ring-cleavage dioxygenase class III enzyme subunit B domain-containing protein n=1 Tax=Candida oxycetoniae TaxID=497107 RepID=A0AAI9SYK4_9ASCO|nr:uncharacterized protein KGF56_002114 [Candida oxycetoniae]KAI3405158.1 hypothetical protein KGF56_002114 [Candida oxycetoniae]